MLKDLNTKILAFIIISIIIISLYSLYISDSSKENDEDNIVLDLVEVEHSYELAKDWLISNFKEKGCFNYIYDPDTGEYSTSNNMIRQLMASRILAELSHDNETLKEMHQKNLDFMFENWYKEDGDFGYIYYNKKSKLGAMGMALRTLVYSPFFDEYRLQAERLANTIFYLQDSDGSFEPWYVDPMYHYDTPEEKEEYNQYLLTFYSGEAILSLVEMYLKTNDLIYLEGAVLSQNYYVDRYVHDLEENYYPAYVPWHTQSLNKLYKITDKTEYADAIMVLNDELLKIQDTENTDTLGRFYNQDYADYGSPHSSSDGVYTEGLAYAYEIAKLIDDTYHMEKFRNAIALGVHNIISLQYTEANTERFEYPERVIGAIKINIEENSVRIDTTQHTIDAYMKILLVC